MESISLVIMGLGISIAFIMMGRLLQEVMGAMREDKKETLGLIERLARAGMVSVHAQTAHEAACAQQILSDTGDTSVRSRIPPRAPDGIRLDDGAVIEPLTPFAAGLYENVPEENKVYEDDDAS